ncbi:MAG TPA: histidine--tRNA ligase [Patescibacteria group bacterium]|nr:histidine--tRNA ligase [Patescibacteria group bacterium]
MKFKKPRGTSDLFGEKIELWLGIEGILTGVMKRYGYTEIRTPIFETTDLFIRAVGEGTDIVTKEMYTFTDKKGRSLTLRPENTAPVMRAFLENGMHRRGGITRFYYTGPMFRYDRPQAGRYRQFHQIGAEAIGSADPAVDAEIIDLSLALYRALGFTQLDVRINSVGCPICRSGYKKVLLKHLREFENDLCGACSERSIINPLRIFDCKECGEVKKRLPVITEHLCDECASHFGKLRNLLDDVGITYTLDPLLVRGLDYYTKTAFEIVHPGVGAQNALCGGGRYDGLAEDCGGDSLPAVGFSAGMERLIEALPAETAAALHGSTVEVYVVLLDGLLAGRALILARKLREAGLSVTVDFSGRNIKKQFKGASESGALYAAVLGPEEEARGSVTVKDLRTGEQEDVTFDRLGAYFSREREGKLRWPRE